MNLYHLISIDEIVLFIQLKVIPKSASTHSNIIYTLGADNVEHSLVLFNMQCSGKQQSAF